MKQKIVKIRISSGHVLDLDDCKDQSIHNPHLHPKIFVTDYFKERDVVSVDIIQKVCNFSLDEAKKAFEQMKVSGFLIENNGLYYFET